MWTHSVQVIRDEERPVPVGTHTQEERLSRAKQLANKLKYTDGPDMLWCKYIVTGPYI